MINFAFLKTFAISIQILRLKYLNVFLQAAAWLEQTFSEYTVSYFPVIHLVNFVKVARL